MSLVVRDPDMAVVSASGREQHLTEEERERRHKEAEELEAKLQYITEKIPTRIMNTSGSNAGAGSGEFHMYRMARRREMMRLARIEEQAQQQAELQAFEDKQERLKAEDDARTAKNRSKRLKKRAKVSSKTGSALNLQPAADASESEAAEAANQTTQPDLD